MRWMIALLIFVICAAGAHYVSIRAVPGFIMERALGVMEERGVPMYQWVASPRQTPETQAVVRPSPDLSYAVCRFDVRDGPVLISAPGWEGYGSLSIFDERTNNVFVANLDGEGASVILNSASQSTNYSGDMASSVNTIKVKGTGIALIRRLAPTDDAHEAAAKLVAGARCDLL